MADITDSQIKEIDSDDVSLRTKLVSLLCTDLNFQGQTSNYSSHNFHSFPAKFPPQFPRIFIEGLTNPGDVILDPMMGSGTTIVEAWLANKQVIGLDIDPLALLVSAVKVTPLDRDKIEKLGNQILENAKNIVATDRNRIEQRLNNKWDSKTKQFIDYWFAPETQIELQALIEQIDNVDNEKLNAFFKVAFSSIIITKSGGVSLALDLGHTRPHKAKIASYKSGGEIHRLSSEQYTKKLGVYLSKSIGSPLVEFERRVSKNLNGLPKTTESKLTPRVEKGDAQCLPVIDSSVDLIVTSPPYASNAIDYMRAHKFSLVWFGYKLKELAQKRRDYIGGEVTENVHLGNLPPYTTEIISRLHQLDKKKGRVLNRYYSEMTKVLQEMYRVLKPDKIAVIVVGTSIMRGQNTETANCLAEIGSTLGFDVPAIATRNIDRNKRMMPAGSSINQDSQIQQRMHKEYVIGYHKPGIKSNTKA